MYLEQLMLPVRMKLDSFLTKNSRHIRLKHSELEFVNLTINEKDTGNLPSTEIIHNGPMSLPVNKQSRSAMPCIFQALADAPNKRDKKQQFKNVEFMNLSESVVYQMKTSELVKDSKKKHRDKNQTKSTGLVSYI